MIRPRRALAAAAGPACAAAVCGLLAGCGVPSTPVPVDAGAAPSRVACGLPRPSPVGTPRDATAEVYLVCGRRVAPVPRRLDTREPDRVRAARVLLAALERGPVPVEAEAGFASEVPAGLTVRGGADQDPPGALRLGQDPRTLPSYAVGQIVCTLAGTPRGASGGTVLLGGPDPGRPVRRYGCDTALRTDPDAGRTAGAPLPSTGP